MNFAVRLLAPAALALAAAPGHAAARTFEEAVVAGVFEVCPAAMEGKLSLNDAAAVAKLGLQAAPDAVEATMTDPHFGRPEVVGGKVGAGEFVISQYGGSTCHVIMRGAGIDGAADAVEARLASPASGYAPDAEHSRAPAGGTAKAFRKPVGPGTAAVVQVIRAQVDGQRSIALMTTIVPD